MEHDPAEIIDGHLWMSSFPDKSWLDPAQFDLVINLTHSRYPQDTGLPAQYIQYPLNDGDIEDVDLNGLTREVVNPAITAVLRGLKVLVHCHAGLNRSGLVSALIWRAIKSYPGKSAVAWIRVKRHPSALCNPSFADYLESLPTPMQLRASNSPPA